jgi:hypothetical protein
VKQQCLSDDFITINDNTKRFARGLYAKQNGGERELDSGGQRERERERERKRVCVYECETEHRRKRK